MGKKVAIIGAGNVGIRYAYCLVIKGIADEIVLIDVDRKRAEGEAMDLSHGAPYIKPVKVYAGSYEDATGADLVVITAGKKQRPGQTRMELAKDNVELFRIHIIPKLMKYCPDAIFLVVSNPVDVLSYATYKFSGKDWRQVIGSGTTLDTARLRYLIARHCNIDARNVHAYVLGEHGDSEFAVWSKAIIGCQFLDKFCAICPKNETCVRQREFDDILQEVKSAAYKIIERKGETSYGIGLSLARITQAILDNENAILPVSCLAEGFYGIEGLYLSLPCVLNSQGIRQVLHLSLSEDEEQALINTSHAIYTVIKACNI